MSLISDERVEELLEKEQRLEAEIVRLTDENRKMKKTLAADAIEIFELRAALGEIVENAHMGGKWCGAYAEAALQPKEGEK